jgi:hypothetical protein
MGLQLRVREVFGIRPLPLPQTFSSGSETVHVPYAIIYSQVSSVVDPDSGSAQTRKFLYVKTLIHFNT